MPNAEDLQPHRFIESGPGRAPTTVRGCIVCPECYQPKRHPIHGGGATLGDIAHALAGQDETPAVVHAELPAPVDAVDPVSPAATLPKPPTYAQQALLERLIAGQYAGQVGATVTERSCRTFGWVTRYDAGRPLSNMVTTEGYNAAGVAAPGQAWGEWTVAYRTRTGKSWATLGRRVRNWAGTWAQALEMAGALLEFLGGDERAQVWYTSTRQAELDGRVTPEDHRRVLLDSGLSLRLTEAGMLPAELLDRDVMNVAAELIAAHRGAGRTDFTHAECREIARTYRDFLGADWAAMVHYVGSADTRWRRSCLAQPWQRDQRPATWADDEAARTRFVVALADLTDTRAFVSGLDAQLSASGDARRNLRIERALGA